MPEASGRNSRQIAHCMGMGAKQKDLCDLQFDIYTLLIVFEDLFTEVWNFLHNCIHAD